MAFGLAGPVFGHLSAPDSSLGSVPSQRPFGSQTFVYRSPYLAAKKENEQQSAPHYDEVRIEMKCCVRAYFEEEVQVITEILDETHVGGFGEYQVFDFLTKGHFGIRQPCPVVGIRPPGVGVLERECQAVVNCSYLDFRRFHHIPIFL